MSGPHRNADKINTIGVVVVGICGAVLVYVSITALEAFYVNDTSEIQTMADYGGQDTTARSVKSDQLGHINEYGANGANWVQTYHVKIDRAMQLVVDGAKVDPGSLVPAYGRSDKSTIDAVPGRPKMVQPGAPAPNAPIPNGPAPTPSDGSGAGAGSGAAGSGAAGSGAGAGSGSPVVAPPPTPAPLVPTGAGPKTQPQPVPGAGPLPPTGEKRPVRPKGATGSGGHAP
jgi:hypothetical protein